MEYEGNKANSYRWLEIKNVSNYPTHCIYHMECGENKITFDQFNARAHKTNPNGVKLITAAIAPRRAMVVSLLTEK
jgi:hypothetical protein